MMRHQEADDEAPDQRKLAPPARVLDVAIGGATPQLRQAEYDCQRQQHAPHPYQQRAQHAFVFGADRVAPLQQLAVTLIEDDDLLAQRDRHVGDLLELRGQRREVMAGGGGLRRGPEVSGRFTMSRPCCIMVFSESFSGRLKLFGGIAQPDGLAPSAGRCRACRASGRTGSKSGRRARRCRRHWPWSFASPDRACLFSTRRPRAPTASAGQSVRQVRAGALAVGDGRDFLQRILDRLVEIEFALQGVALRDERLARLAGGFRDLVIQVGDLRLDVGDATGGVPTWPW